jgi:arginase family enzyme
MPQGIAESVEQAIIYLESSPILGFWLHLDVDVLSPEWMFAGGLTRSGRINARGFSNPVENSWSEQALRWYADHNL